jgi:hypothetical protein
MTPILRLYSNSSDKLIDACLGWQVAWVITRGPFTATDLPGNRANEVLRVHLADSQIIAACLSAGAFGHVLKELMDSDLIPAINEVLADRIFVSRLSSE